jgi:hypothetical protein
VNKGLVPLTERQKTLIVNNVLAACKDITKLNGTGYNFLYLASGFIAHYNRFGFMDYYSDGSLAQDILNNARNNQWNNFYPGERDYEYMMAKRDVYNRIVAGLETFFNIDRSDRW